MKLTRKNFYSGLSTEILTYRLASVRRSLLCGETDNDLRPRPLTTTERDTLLTIERAIVAVLAAR